MFFDVGSGTNSPTPKSELVNCYSVNWIQLSEETVQLGAVVNTTMDVEDAWDREIALPVNNCRIVRILQRYGVVT